MSVQSWYNNNVFYDANQILLKPTFISVTEGAEACDEFLSTRTARLMTCPPIILGILRQHRPAKEASTSNIRHLQVVQRAADGL